MIITRRCWLATLSACLVAPTGWAFWRSFCNTDNNNVAEATIDELIEALRNEEVPGMCYDPRGSAQGFACAGKAAFQSGILGSGLRRSPVLCEIVSRGAASLPALLEHLADVRTTGVKVRQPIAAFGAAWFSDEYDPRFPGAAYPVNQGMEVALPQPYTIRIGDLCYVAVGQIVNRHLYAVRYQPSTCVVVNSPVENPELANAARRDWGNCNTNDHIDSLLGDLGENSYREGAILRLRYYYPFVSLPQWGFGRDSEVS